jgi:predicted enzyme related to lactoylglutathione lyase
VAVKLRGLAWLGIRTQHFEDTVEVFGSGDRDHEHFETGPVVGFLVDDVEEARAGLEAVGNSFIGPVHSSEEGNSWAHFVGPDGNVYELTGDHSQT